MKEFYQKAMYGIWRRGETVTYARNGENDLAITVSMNDSSVTFDAKLYLPNPENAAKYPSGCPFIVCMHPIMPQELALSEGYALIVLNTYQLASDDCKHNGLFYELYPYGADDCEQTGVLMAWAWGCSKVLDAVYNGLGAEVGLDPDASIVTGVSRWGKATAVCGAFDERFRLTMPTCSGAGGLALYQVQSEGKTYDLTKVGGPADYVYGKNEPLDCLQSEAERGWFNDQFLTYKKPEDIPYDQENLPVLAASKDRYYFIVGACMGEDWVNAPSMFECYQRANLVYEKLGLSNHLIAHFHKEGHAVIEEDLKLLIQYFNTKYYGMDTGLDMAKLKPQVYPM